LPFTPLLFLLLALVFNEMYRPTPPHKRPLTAKNLRPTYLTPTMCGKIGHHHLQPLLI
jgi:hypothetical protein